MFLNNLIKNNNPVQIIYGLEKRRELEKILEGKVYRILSSKRGKEFLVKDKWLSKFLNKDNIISEINNYPDISLINRILKGISNNNIDIVVGFGGGSVIDVAKIIGLCLASENKNIKLDHIIYENKLKRKKNIKTICIPTTFGTGSEVTSFATIWDFIYKKKYSLNTPDILPEISIIDPELGIGMPRSIMISTGLDAINQAAESLWNKNSTFSTIEISVKSLTKGITAIKNLSDDQTNLNFWEEMSQCSLLSGLAICKTKTALCHSISYPLTSHFNIPHGIACAFTMPSVLDYCLEKDDGRFLKLAENFGITNNYKSNLKIIFNQLNEQFEIKELIKQKVKNENELLKLINEMYDPSRADNLIRKVNFSDIEKILKKSIK